MPTINGILYRKADHLTAREAQEGDTNALGEPIQPGRKVIVRKKECHKTEDGMQTDVAPPIPQIHESDYIAYGEWHHQQDRENKRWIGGEPLTEWYTCPIYRVEIPGPVVFQGSIYSTIDPRVEALRRETGIGDVEDAPEREVSPA